MKKKYLLTGTTIVLLLIGLVAGGRFLTKAETAVETNNVKKRGPEDAPVVLTVYSDFQCPACQKAVLPVEELRKEFADDMRVEFRHFPLERAHRWALPAAIFAECAAAQGKFWEYHDRLYSEQSNWTSLADAIPALVRYAQEAGLSREPFEQCVGDPKILERIRAERMSGEKRQVQSTPTVFINDERLVGSLELIERGKNIVLAQLAKHGRKEASSEGASLEDASKGTPL